MTFYLVRLSIVDSFVCLPGSSLRLVRFGQLLHCTDKRIVNIMKVYINRNNMQVGLKRAVYNSNNLLCRRHPFWSYPTGLTIADRRVNKS